MSGTRFALSAVLMASLTWAQIGSGTIAGTVLDTSGSSIAGTN